MFDPNKPYQRRDSIRCEIVKRLKQNTYLVVSTAVNGNDFYYEVFLDGKEFLLMHEGRYDLVNISNKTDYLLGAKQENVTQALELLQKYLDRGGYLSQAEGLAIEDNYSIFNSGGDTIISGGDIKELLINLLLRITKEK